MSAFFYDNIERENTDIATPEWLKKALDEEFHFDFDPCPLGGKTNPDVSDGLQCSWGKCNFINPPFKQIHAWLQKGVREFNQGKKCVFLITAKLWSDYYFKYVYPNACEMRFFRYNFKFEGYKTHFPIGISILVFDPENSSRPFKDCVHQYNESGMKYLRLRFVHFFYPPFINDFFFSNHRAKQEEKRDSLEERVAVLEDYTVKLSREIDELRNDLSSSSKRKKRKTTE